MATNIVEHGRTKCTNVLRPNRTLTTYVVWCSLVQLSEVCCSLVRPAATLCSLVQIGATWFFLVQIVAV